MKTAFPQTVLVAVAIAGLLAFVSACRSSARKAASGGAAMVESGTEQTATPAASVHQSADPDYKVIAVDEDRAVFAKIVETRDTNGRPLFLTNRYTLLENALSYQENGEWRASEDIIESFPDGAIARRGPHKAIFSHDLNADAVFDIQASDGVRLRGGIRSIHLTDSGNGRSVLIGAVKPTVPAELLPPNRIVFRDAFQGQIRADVLIVWRHNSFAQDLVLRSRPVLPAGFAPETTRVEIATEFLQPPQPQIQEDILRRAGRPDLPDHRFIRLGKLDIIGGRAFPVEAGAGFSIGSGPASGDATPVLKQWETLPDGRKFLIESISWEELSPHLDNLAVAAADSVNGLWKDEVLLAKVIPERKHSVLERKSVQLASTTYDPTGFLVDWVLVPETSPTTFNAGETYIVRTSYYTGSATFQPGCVVKNYSLGRIYLTGSFSLPDTFQSCVFTSTDDDGFGVRFPGNANPYVPASDGDPSTGRPNALLEVSSLYSSTEIRNSLFRWGYYGLAYSQTAAFANHVVRNCRFENFQTGSHAALYIYTPTSSTVSLVSSDKANVNQDVYNVQSSPVSGTLATANFYTDKSFTGTPMEQASNIKVPDTMGAVGPNHYVEMIMDRVRVYNKATGAIIAGQDMGLAEFFGLPAPQGGIARMIDPDITYDFLSQAWVAVAANFESANRDVYMAIKSGTSPEPLSSWKRFPIVDIVPPGPQWITDYPRVAWDANGVYVTAIGVDYDIAAGTLAVKSNFVFGFAKPTVYTAPGNPPFTLHMFPPSQTGIFAEDFALQPVRNFNSTVSGGYAWILCKNPPTGTGVGYQPGLLKYMRFWWSGGNFTHDAAWTDIANCSGAKRYYAFQPAWNAVPANGAPQYDTDVGVRKVGTSLGSRPQSPLIRGNYLWLCQQAGLDGIDEDFDGDESGDSVDRSGIRWLKLQVASNGSSLTCAETGILSDTASSNPYWYYCPSVMVNSAGHMLFGFSLSRETEFIGGAYQGRTSAGVLDRVRLCQAGRATHLQPNARIWGDYSSVSLDPANNSTFWSIQAFTPTTESWATWITSIAVAP